MSEDDCIVKVVHRLGLSKVVCDDQVQSGFGVTRLFVVLWRSEKVIECFGLGDAISCCKSTGRLECQQTGSVKKFANGTYIEEQS